MKSIKAFTLAIIFSIVSAFSVRAQTAETIWLTANTTAFKTGETVIVTVNAISATPIQGFTFQISYDPACLEPMHATSPIPGMNGLQLPQTSGLVDASFASTSPQTANGVLAEVRFITLGACQTSLQLKSAALAIRNEAGFAAPLTGVTINESSLALAIDSEKGTSQELPFSGTPLLLGPETPASTSALPAGTVAVLAVIGVLVVIGVIAALLAVDKARAAIGLQGTPPSLHMCFTGNPGTGKTTVAMKMAGILHRLGYVRKGHLVAVTRDDLVGQYIGHTAPKTREVLKRAMGGVLFIDEAYYLYRPENERDYGQEAVEILLQVMENQRDDLVVILAGYKDRMARFFECNPGFSSRIAHHVDFPDYSREELEQIAQLMLERMGYAFDAPAREAFARYLERRMARPHFANARSVRNALDRARLRHASRVFARLGAADREALTTIVAEDILASRVFEEEPC